MKAARRVDIVQRHSEDQSTEQPAEPVQAAMPGRSGTPADDVVASVDRLEQRIQMICGPGLDRGRYQHQR
jgi:hypothetical protein